MGSKKRSLESMEVEEGQLDAPANEVVSNDKLKKKMKKQKGKDESLENKEASTSGVLNSVKPMERRKKRKALDKERRHVVLENKESKPKKMDVEVQASTTVEPSSGSSLPEFHIGVFKDLASLDGSVREAAVEALVTELQEVQKAYDRLENKDLIESGLKLEAEKDDGLNQCAPSLRYAVRRLIRGVSSSRECARQGFALGLTILVGTIPGIKVDSLLKLVNDLLEITSSMKGQEARESLLGRLFAYGSLARSGRLAEEWMSNRNTPYIKEFISLIISLAVKKRYLQEPAVSVILDLIEKLPPEAVVNHVLEAPGLGEWFAGATEVGNPDALLLALKIREKTSIDSTVYGKLLPETFCPNKVFASEHLSSLATCLKESTFCQPRVHSVWPVLVNILLPDTLLQARDVASVSSSLKKHKKNRKSSSSEEEIAKNLQCFVEVIIEGSLLLSSHDRKHLAFDVLLLLLPRLPASFVPIILSYKFVQCLMDILSTKDSWLFKVAQHFLKELSNWVKRDDVKKVGVIVAIQKHSNGKFDSITRTKTVKEFMADFSTESGCMLFIQNLQDMFVDENHPSEEPSDQSQTTDDNSEMGSIEDKDSVGTQGNSDFLKTWIVESLPSVLKYLKLDFEAKFRIRKEILKFLAIQGVFTASLGTEVTSFELQEKFRWPKVATSNALCRMCIEQLQLLLANAQKGEGSRALSSGLEPNDLGSYFMRFVSTLRNIPSISLFRSLDDEEESVFKKLQTTETSLSREEKNCGLSSDANRLHALRYLLIQLLLQMLLRPREFSEAASELIICCKIAFPTTDLLESSGEEDADDATPAVMDVLVDTLLSLLPQSSAPMRTAIEQVFKYFCVDITDDGLLRMLRVIKKTLKSARHQVAESDDDDDDEEDDEDFLKIEEEEDEVIDNAETGETGESEEHTDDSEAVGGLEEVDKEVSAASDDSDGGMDDDAMFRMDTYLAQIFKERKAQAGSETAQYQLMLFKLRVLSLLEIYLHENPGKSQVLLVYSNLARALVNPLTAESSEQLGQRIWGIFQKKIFKAKDYPRGEGVQLPTLESLLQKNLKLASKPIKKKKLVNKKQSASWNRQKMIASLAQNSTFWILKIIDAKNFPEAKLQGVFDIFQRVLVEYFDSKKSQIKSEYLKEIFRRRPWIGRRLLGLLLEKCGSTKSDFRRVEALDLIMEISKSLGPADIDNIDALHEFWNSHLSKLSLLIKVLVTNKPEKQSRRAEVRKFCGRIFQYLKNLKLAEPFLNSLNQEARALCQSQISH
ncbi:DNA polymerase V [Parasponia andersonii]|uniref:DNA polymerase V n=1 Tax=Parasponia andersonii TaxID=3476 RepID=A0A2P5A7R7_PARAD|nr:DNA polymerase V [Parasponia andersonii]